jgi:hypothetical protein
LLSVIARGFSKASKGESRRPGAVEMMIQTAAKPITTSLATDRQRAEGIRPDGKTRRSKKTPAISGVQEPAATAAASVPAGSPASGFASSASSP